MIVGNNDYLRRILGYDRVAVASASTSYEKAAHIVPAYLQRHGYEISPINPPADEIFGSRPTIHWPTLRRLSTSSRSSAE